MMLTTHHWRSLIYGAVKRQCEKRERRLLRVVISSAVGTAWSGGEGGWRWVLHLPVTVLLCHAAPVRKGADVQ